MRGFALAAFLLVAVPLHGQMPEIDPDTRLRVRTVDATVRAVMVRWSGDSLVVRPEGDAAARHRADHRLAISDILGLEREAPMSRGRGAARGALWGGIAGGVVGAVIGGTTETGCAGCWIETRGASVALGTALAGGLGAGVGAVVGALFPGRGWEPVPLPRER